MGEPRITVRVPETYQRIVRSARDRLAGGQARPVARCPACEQEEAATGEALDVSFASLADEAVQPHGRDRGGLCIPHFRAAAERGPHDVIRRLAEIMAASLVAPGASRGWLVGAIDDDATVRVELRRAMPDPAPRGPEACAACLAMARAEREALARLFGPGGAPPDADPLLCASHLGDAAAFIGGGGRLIWLVGWQADRQIDRWSAMSGAAGGRTRHRTERRRRGKATSCDVCRDRDAAEARALDAIRRMVRGPALRPTGPEWACVRHLIALRACDPRERQVLTASAIARADELISEPASMESDTWRRAAAFLDGGVLCGCSPGVALTRASFGR